MTVSVLGSLSTSASPSSTNHGTYDLHRTMLPQSQVLSSSNLSKFVCVPPVTPSIEPGSSSPSKWRNLSFSALIPPPNRHTLKLSVSMASSSSISNHTDEILLGNGKEDLDVFVEVASKAADASGEVIRKYFRKKFEILDKADSSPVTIADREAEESMVSIILENFPTHAIYGEENGWRCKEKFADYVWVLDPIDGTKSFITGKPLFGTLIALLHKGKPILGVINQPILWERWIGIRGKRTTLNGHEISTRSCDRLSNAYMYTTSPHFFSGEAEEAFSRVRDKVKVPLYGCDCYAYALLASGFVDLVIESGLKPYDFLSLIPVIEGAGGVLTDWNGQPLAWEASFDSQATNFNVVAAGGNLIHKQALDLLAWQ